MYTLLATEQENYNRVSARRGGWGHHEVDLSSCRLSQPDSDSAWAHTTAARRLTREKVTLKGPSRNGCIQSPLFAELDVTGEEPDGAVDCGGPLNVIFGRLSQGLFKAGIKSHHCGACQEWPSMGRILQAVLADGKTPGPAASHPVHERAPQPSSVRLQPTSDATAYTALHRTACTALHTVANDRRVRCHGRRPRW
jgi:hypothetical protein